MKVYKVLLYESACPLIEQSIDSVIESLRVEIEEKEVGEKTEFSVEPIDMAEDEFRSLPEWSGP